MLRRAVELGVNFIDTADSYGPEVSETLIAEALFPYPDGLVVATKGGLERPGPGRWIPNGAPDHLVRACEGSLARLRLEQIPLYQFHRPDPRVPFEESVGALVELKQQGKIRHIGLSNVDADQLRRAQRLTRSCRCRTATTSPIAARSRWSTSASNRASPSCRGRRSRRPTRRVVSEIAARHHASERQVTLAWLLARSSVMLPIPGTGSPAHLEDNVAAAALRLGDDEIAALNAAGNKDSRLRRSLRSGSFNSPQPHVAVTDHQRDDVVRRVSLPVRPEAKPPWRLNGRRRHSLLAPGGEASVAPERPPEAQHGAQRAHEIRARRIG